MKTAEEKRSAKFSIRKCCRPTNVNVLGRCSPPYILSRVERAPSRRKAVGRSCRMYEFLPGSTISSEETGSVSNVSELANEFHKKKASEALASSSCVPKNRAGTRRKDRSSSGS